MSWPYKAREHGTTSTAFDYYSGGESIPTKDEKTSGDDDDDVDIGFVGRKDEMEQLSAAVVGDCKPSLKVLVIWGMGGLGKTTLARNLYNSDNVIQNFRIRKWVRFPPRLSVEAIMEAFGVKGDGDWRRHLYDLLRNGPYFLVVDDVWGEEVWRRIKVALPDDSNGSRVLITTRYQYLKAGQEGWLRNEMWQQSLHLPFLTQQESWDLFRQRASSLLPLQEGEEAAAAALQVERCDGLPLAIVMLADLYNKSPKKKPEEWPDTNEKFWNEISSNNDDSISRVLAPAYNSLGPQLRDCFLYMSMFPQGYEFDINKLIRLWVAEEFIGPIITEGETDEILYELIGCGLVHVTETLWGKIAKCRLHGLVRSLALQWAKKIGFFDIFDPYVYDTVELDRTTRRHGVHGYLQNYVPHVHPNQDLHTLLFFKHHREYFPKIDRLLSKCEKYASSLRVLDLKGIRVGSNQQLHHMLLELVHLLFLGLSDTFVREIPSSIGNLTLLQTLEAGGEYSCRLPPEMSKLKKLRHVIGHFEGPLHIQNSEQLQTLNDVDLDQMSEAGGINWTSLSELGLRISPNASSPGFEPRLPRLETLIVTSAKHEPLLGKDSPAFTNQLERVPFSQALNLQNIWLDGPIANNLSVLTQLMRLTYLIISRSDSEEDPMPALGNLVHLRNLELIDSFGWKTFNCVEKGFPSLETLQLCQLYALEELNVNDEAMAKLKKFTVYKCDKLRLPARFQGILRYQKPSSASYMLQMFLD